MTSHTLIPVIIAGGSGTRLWPLSRKFHPKPLIEFEPGKTLISETYLRAASLSDGPILTVTNRELFFGCRDEYERAGLHQPHHLLLEPVGRSTTGAIAAAALYAVEHFGADAQLLILSADHRIKDLAAFGAAVDAAAVRIDDNDSIVTFGVLPTHAETGYGYIEAADQAPVAEIARFIEKPDAAKAEKLIASGNCYWNAGIFQFRAQTMVDALAEFQPETLEAVRAAIADGRRDEVGDAIGFHLGERFADAVDISIDYGVMERTDRGAVVRAEFDWSDVGSWSAVADMHPADEAGNSVEGEAILEDSHNCYVHSPKRLTALVGTRDLVIVDTDDAILVADKSQAQNVKAVVERLKARGDERHLLHTTVYRPWGSYTILEEQEGFKLKRIEVRQGASLSLQKHHHRSEHWVVVSGTAEVVNGDQTLLLRPNESTYIPAGNVHRLSNPGKIRLVMIEVQCGQYLGEDDIVRLEDVYGRL